MRREIREGWEKNEEKVKKTKGKIKNKAFVNKEDDIEGRAVDWKKNRIKIYHMQIRIP